MNWSNFSGELAIDFEQLRRQEFCAELRVVEDFLHVGIDLRDHLARRPGRRGEAEPGCGLVARQPALGHRRGVGKLRDAMGTPDGEDLELACLERLHDEADADRHQVDVARHDVVERGRGAAVVNRLELHARHVLELGDVHVGGGADPRRAVGDLARLSFRERDQLAHVRDGELVARDQRLVDAHEAGDRRKVFLDVVAELLRGIERLIERKGPRLGHQQGVAVGDRSGDGLRAQHVGAAALVLDDYRLIPHLGQPLPDRPRHHVGDAARRRRHIDGDRLRGVRLRMERRAEQAAQQDRQCKPLHHGSAFGSVPSHRSRRAQCAAFNRAGKPRMDAA